MEIKVLLVVCALLVIGMNAEFEDQQNSEEEAVLDEKGQLEEIEEDFELLDVEVPTLHAPKKPAKVRPSKKQGKQEGKRTKKPAPKQKPARREQPSLDV